MLWDDVSRKLDLAGGYACYSGEALGQLEEFREKSKNHSCVENFSYILFFLKILLHWASVVDFNDVDFHDFLISIFRS